MTNSQSLDENEEVGFPGKVGRGGVEEELGETVGRGGQMKMKVGVRS